MWLMCLACSRLLSCCKASTRDSQQDEFNFKVAEIAHGDGDEEREEIFHNEECA